MPLQTAYSPNRPTAVATSPPKPRTISNWENPNLKHTLVNRFHTQTTLIFGIACSVGGAMFFSLAHFRHMRPLLHNMMYQFLQSDEYIIPAGYFIAVALFAISSIAFLRYFTPPYTGTLTNAQRELLGLPPTLGAPTTNLIDPNQYGPYSPSYPHSPLMPSPGLSSVTPTSTPPLYRSTFPTSSTSPLSPIDGSIVSPTNVHPSSPLSPNLNYPQTTTGYPSPGTTAYYDQDAFQYSPTTTGSGQIVRTSWPNSPRSPSAYPLTPVDRRFSKTGYSPSPSKEYNEIMDERALDRYLAEEQEKDKLRYRVENVTASSYDPYASTGPIPLQKYRPAYRPVPRSVTSRTNDDFRWVNAQASEELLERLNVEEYIDVWTENMRKWLVANLLKPLVVKIKQFNHYNISLVHPLNQPLPTTTPLWQSSSLTGAPQPPPENDMNAIATARNRLEKYTRVLGSTSREYLIQRIEDLAEGEYMAAFRWNGGGKWKGKDWTPELPTDSQIMIHLFNSFMDDQMNVDQQPESKPFTAKHVVVFPETPDTRKTSVAIYQKHIHPPHFELAVSNPSETWEIYQGRNNLFQTLVLFTYYVKIELSGYLDHIWLGSKQIKLLDVLAT